VLIYKDGVKLVGIRPETVAAIDVANSIYSHFDYNCIVTSVIEGKHGSHSLHYVGLAVDFRIRHLDPDIPHKIVKLLRRHLTDEYDVVLEIDHLHIEVDPKYAGVL